MKKLKSCFIFTANSIIFFTGIIWFGPVMVVSTLFDKRERKEIFQGERWFFE